MTSTGLPSAGGCFEVEILIVIVAHGDLAVFFEYGTLVCGARVGGRHGFFLAVRWARRVTTSVVASMPFDFAAFLNYLNFALSLC
jgi:hypothetical protein